MEPRYDALLLVSFGGPEGVADVEPFLDNVLRGRAIPPERRRAVAGHYLRRGGVSPINGENRALLAALRAPLAARFPALRLYWGNRNWHPLLADTVRRMRADGITRALAFVTSAFGSYSGCRQYQEDIARARAEAGPGAPAIDKLRLFYNHPGFIAAVAAGIQDALHQLPASRRSGAGLLFTAHSIPVAMASAGPYVSQLEAAGGLVAAALGRRATGSAGVPPAGLAGAARGRQDAGAPRGDWRLGYQSRSGSPRQPWLEPDIAGQLAAIAGEGRHDVVVAPLGFLSDHMEVVHDLDIEARAEADRLGLNMVRAATPGSRPELVEMILALVAERVTGAPRLALGPVPADTCEPDCCHWARPGEGTGAPPHTETAPAMAGSKTT